MAIHHRTDARATPRCDSRIQYPFRFELARRARHRANVSARTYARSAPREARTGRQIRRTDSLQSRLSKSTRLRLECRDPEGPRRASHFHGARPTSMSDRDLLRHCPPKTRCAIRTPLRPRSSRTCQRRLRDTDSSEQPARPTCDPCRVKRKGQVNQRGLFRRQGVACGHPSSARRSPGSCLHAASPPRWFAPARVGPRRTHLGRNRRTHARTRRRSPTSAIDTNLRAHSRTSNHPAPSLPKQARVAP